MRLIELIKSDVAAHNIGGFVKTYFRVPSFRYTFWLRCCIAWKKNRYAKYTICVPAFLILRRLELICGVSISTNIEIGYSLCIVHGGNVFLNVLKIGNNCRVYQGVTCGSNDIDGIARGIPEIGNNVTICTNSVVFGNVKLNDGCIIGAGSIVAKDVEANCTVGGNLASVIRRNKER